MAPQAGYIMDVPDLKLASNAPFGLTSFALSLLLVRRQGGGGGGGGAAQALAAQRTARACRRPARRPPAAGPYLCLPTCLPSYLRLPTCLPAPSAAHPAGPCLCVPHRCSAPTPPTAGGMRHARCGA